MLSECAQLDSELEMENYRLNWDKHEINITMAFNSLRKDEHFSDVTLACENRQFQAHKVVLSAGSSFFEQILKSHKHPSPLVYLKGVEAKHMELFLDYMYSGEVVLKQEELENFLKTGQELGLKGLAISDNVENSSPQNEVIPCADKTPCPKLDQESPTPEASPLWKEPSLAKIARPSKNSLLVVEPSITCGDSGTLVKSEEFDTSFDTVATDHQISEWKDLKNYVVVVQKGKCGGNRAKSIYKCSLCERIMNHAEAMMTHIESVHFRDAFTHICQICERTFETRASLNYHKQKEHKIKSDST